ncbi:DoxX family protein [Longispora albida]|uniref:DoxX family protein n=1 Tax=Longispora albida TaxID=203523 RepID=UPI00036BCF98|nr:DoxX family protein [Longispora albida]
MTTNAKPRKVTSVLLWTGQIVLGLLFVWAAAPKLLGDPLMVQSFETIGFGQWFRVLTGVCELAGGIGLLIPPLAGLAALGLAGVMAGATLTNLFLLPGQEPIAITTVVLGAIFLLIARGRHASTRALLTRLRRQPEPRTA